MRIIILLSLLIFIASCNSTKESIAKDDVYDVPKRGTSSEIYYDEIESRSYNDIVYNDPWIYNSSRFGFGFGIVSPHYYGPYWGNSWYWGYPYGYYNSWNSGIYYNSWGYYGCGWTYYHNYGFYGCNTDFGYNSYIISPRPSMVGRSIILNPRPRSNNSLLRPSVDSPKTINPNRPVRSNDRVRAVPNRSNQNPHPNPPRINPSRSDRNVPRNPNPSPAPRSSNRSPRR